uniref:U25-Sparatoxin-Hju1c_1 n=1 Tax=Heteropoda jugulans TaxID=1358901 RepID=A0A4Q8KDD5_9ARAC
MKFVFSVVLMVITLLFVVSAETPEVENDVSDILERGRKKCAKLYEPCYRGNCCKGHTCICSYLDGCLCLSRLDQIPGLWRNWE